MGTNATRATELLRRSGVAHEVRAYDAPERHGRQRDDRPDYGREAAAALGVPPATVCKTLVAVADGQLVLAIVPSDRQLDLKALATTVGARAAGLAEVGQAERATGYVVGGISPLAPRRPLRTVVDTDVLAHDRIHVSAGRRGLQILLAPTDLVRVLAATVAPIARTD